ncbi:hypothetical protein OZZ18_11130 [[Ruminococcus] gnavus]|uniref:hypothetical protein n=1 Tax=Mediterraneibacter gnavus TaxID=33038 RepID=UPI002286510C|nr:hypothetical protein [Mediterraneibacter gnavus]MCZ0647450.1 hypothetical protein [Mediterraneibacter gnavus]
MSKTGETWMDGITTEMMEHICDNLCRHPDQLSEMELEDKCAECKMLGDIRRPAMSVQAA